MTLLKLYEGIDWSMVDTTLAEWEEEKSGVEEREVEQTVGGAKASAEADAGASSATAAVTTVAAVVYTAVQHRRSKHCR